MDYNVMRKITVKAVCGAIPHFSENEGPRDLLTIIGVANGVREVEDKFHIGEVAYGIVGTFEVVNLETGDVTTASEAFLPGVIQDSIVKALKSDPTQDIKFGVKLSVKASDKPIGYEYFAKQLIKPTGVDLLSELRNAIKALPAPNVDIVEPENTKKSKKA